MAPNTHVPAEQLEADAAHAADSFLHLLALL